MHPLQLNKASSAVSELSNKPLRVVSAFNSLLTTIPYPITPEFVPDAAKAALMADDEGVQEGHDNGEVELDKENCSRDGTGN